MLNVPFVGRTERCCCFAFDAYFSYLEQDLCREIIPLFKKSYVLLLSSIYSFLGHRFNHEPKITL